MRRVQSAGFEVPGLETSISGLSIVTSSPRIIGFVSHITIFFAVLRFEISA